MYLIGGKFGFISIRRCICVDELLDSVIRSAYGTCGWGVPLLCVYIHCMSGHICKIFHIDKCIRWPLWFPMYHPYRPARRV